MSEIETPPTPQAPVNPNYQIEEEHKQEEIKSIKKARKLLVGYVIIIAIIFLAISALLVYYAFTYQKPVTTPETPEIENPQTMDIETFVPEKFLYAMYPDYNNLTLDDMPDISDVRDVSEYNGHTLVVGFGKLVEYDTAANKFVRVSVDENPDFYDGTKIGTKYYLVQNLNTSTDLYPQLYVLDLETGKVELTVGGNSAELPYNLTNLSLNSLNNELWISSNAQVLRLDAESLEVKNTYNLSDLGYTGQATCDNPPILTPNKNAIEVVEFACKNFISTFNYETEVWDYAALNNIQPENYINQSLDDYNLDIPRFYALSKQVNNNYYTLTNKGIYKITQLTLPEVYHATPTPLELFNKNFIETSDENTFVIASISLGEGLIGVTQDTAILRNIIKLYTINTDTGVITDHMDNDIYGALEIADLTNFSANFDKLENTVLEVEGNTATLKTAAGTLLLIIDINTGIIEVR